MTAWNALVFLPRISRSFSANGFGSCVHVWPHTSTVRGFAGWAGADLGAAASIRAVCCSVGDEMFLAFIFAARTSAGIAPGSWSVANARHVASAIASNSGEKDLCGFMSNAPR